MDISPKAKKARRERQLNQVTSNVTKPAANSKSHVPPTGSQPRSNRRVDIGNTTKSSVTRKANGKRS